MTSTRQAAVSKTRVIALETVGSLSAPPGSREWVRAVQVELQALLDEATSDLRAIQVYLKGLVDTKGYQQLDDEFGHPFPTLRAFAQAPRPWGLAYDPDLLDAIQAEARPMTLGAILAEKKAMVAAENQAADAAKVGTPGGQPGNQNAKQSARNTNTDTKNNSVSIRNEKHGNDNAYALRRLKVVNSDLHAQCLAGELTVNSAMIQAGLRKRPPSRKRTPLEWLHIYWRQVAPEDRLRFLIEMLTPNERRALQFGFDENEREETP